MLQLNMGKQSCIAQVLLSTGTYIVLGRRRKALRFFVRPGVHMIANTNYTKFKVPALLTSNPNRLIRIPNPK